MLFEYELANLDGELRRFLEQEIEQSVYEIVNALDVQGDELNLTRICCKLKAALNLARNLQDRSALNE